MSDNESAESENVAQNLEEDFVTLAPTTESKPSEEVAQEEPVEEDQIFDEHKDIPPWMRKRYDSLKIPPIIALHNEIVDFCKLMEPRKTEMEQRNDLVKSFTALVHSTFKGVQVEVFGSQATGLCLPSSDIDMVILLDNAESAENGQLESNDTKPAEQERKDMENWATPTGSPLQRLAGALREQWIQDLSYLEVIENTRVPLVKFTHGPTNISVDVCFDQKTGVQAAKLMRQYMDALPPLRPLTFVLKYFLASRGLNQPYTGGVGSFMLQLMILSFLQHRERAARHFRKPSNNNLGIMLLEFFEFYSLDFNYITVGVSIRFDGYFFPKGAADRKNEFWQPSRQFSFAMENPLEPTLDAGAPSFRISMIQRSFEVAARILLRLVTRSPGKGAPSVLAFILPPTNEMENRSFRSIPKSDIIDLSQESPVNEGIPSPPRKKQRL